jgi:hypothetical protein
VAKLKEVCKHIRSKNAGPFWVTVDLFFDGPQNYAKYRNSDALGPAIFGAIFGTDPGHVRRTAVDTLHMVKISYPRPRAQGWKGERDMHAGQQYVSLLDIELDQSLTTGKK